MLKTLTRRVPVTQLPDLGAVRVQGADSLRFLQGQLSNDTERLTATSSQLTGLHTPQGRVIALLRLIVVGPDEVLAVLPRELAAAVAVRLSKFVLRAKAKVTDASPDWEFSGLTLADAAEAETVQVDAPLPSILNGQAHHERSFTVRIAESPARWLVATPRAASPEDAAPHAPANVGAGSAAPAGTGEGAQRSIWRALDIAAGIPQVYAATTETFVAQMLNLDVLGAVSFDKGCYTGQEIIARAHYRGRVKRRMQRFRTAGAASLLPGDTLTLRDGRSVRVVEAVQLADGRCEFLAVAQLGTGEEEPAEAGTPASLSSASPPASSLEPEPLPLPYELPT